MMAEVGEFLEKYTNALAYGVAELHACEHEPITSCGAIQDIGYFLAVDYPTLAIRSVSQNLETLSGYSTEELLDLRLETLFSTVDGRGFDVASVEFVRQQRYPHIYLKKKSGETVDLKVTLSSDPHVLSLDLEIASSHTGQSSNESLHRLIAALEGSNELENDCNLVCQAFQLISGFDRVMAYRFHDNWDGEVVAEVNKSDYEPFLGLRYPSTDIPEQARNLYLRSAYRMIVDSRALPVPVLTRAEGGRMSIDLAQSNLRASSPIHIEYLWNMGVRSSFSIPIKVHNKLWGLISCHHYESPKFLDLETRSTLELLGRILSGRIRDYIEKRRILAKKNSLEFTQSFIQNLTNGLATRDSFHKTEPQLLHLIHATGAFVRIQGDDIYLGDCPVKSVIEDIIVHAQSQSTMSLWKSTSLKYDLDLPSTPTHAAGALVVPLSFNFDDVVIWFRPEVAQEVKWGGNPEKLPNELGRLTPRASFAAWVEKIRDHSSPWSEENEESAQFLLFHFIRGIFSKAQALSLANKELERVTRAKDEFIGLVSHELRTPLSAIIGWIDILKDSVPPNNDEAMEAIEIIDRNAKLQTTLINDLLDISRIISGKLRIALKPKMDVAAITRDVTETLTPTASAKGVQLKYAGETSLLASVDADRLRQIIWNLVTNAIKFTPPNGKVDVRLVQVEQNYHIMVTDTGVGLSPDNLKSIFDRFSQVEGAGTSKGGLGLGLSIVKSLVELHGGLVSASSPGIGQGSTFTAQLPIFALFTEAPTETGTITRTNHLPMVLRNQKVLLAEDQRDTGAALKHLVEKMGAQCSLYYDGQSALNALENEKFDLIISDVGMPFLNGYEFMKMWRAKEKSRNAVLTPAIALTAYATSKDRTAALESGFQSHIPKPIDRSELIAVIESLQLQNT